MTSHLLKCSDAKQLVKSEKQLPWEENQKSGDKGVAESDRNVFIREK